MHKLAAEFSRGQAAIQEAALLHNALVVDLTQWVWRATSAHAICVKQHETDRNGLTHWYDIELKPNDFAPLLVAIMQWYAAGKPRYAYRKGKDVY